MKRKALDNVGGGLTVLTPQLRFGELLTHEVVCWINIETANAEATEG